MSCVSWTSNYVNSFYCLILSHYIVTRLTQLVVQPTPLHNNLCYFEGFGEYVDPISCKFYYACTNSRSIRMPCPAGLFFQPTSRTTGFCDFPRNVQCTGNGVRPTDPVFVTTTTASTRTIGKPKNTTTTTKSTTTKYYHPRKLH